MTTRLGMPGIAAFALACLAVLAGGVLWAAGRGLELTDEAYYLLSAIHPDQVSLYISAQHWVLAPLWRLTESLWGFRLTGAALLLATSSLLAAGVWHAVALTTGRSPDRWDRSLAVAAGGIGALLYVATIAPSPSYNLLASAGMYAAMGFALLASGPRRPVVAAGLAIAGGLALAVCLVSKPSAGICVGLVIAACVAMTERAGRALALCTAGLVGVVAGLAVLVATQPRDPGVIDSLRGGLELFRMVQTEPVAERLLRYAATMLEAFAKAIATYAVPLILLAAYMRRPRKWLLALLVVAILLNLYLAKGHLGGMQSYRRMAEAIYMLVAVGVVLGMARAALPGRARVVLWTLLALPFAATIGTGNSLFTQVIVALAPWTVAVAVLASLADPTARRAAALRGTVAVLLALLTVHVTTSYLRDPYHLAQPLSGQTWMVQVPDLGKVLVDTETARFLDQMTQARATCRLNGREAYLGLFNLPGVALTLGAVPPVTPWINNTQQAETVLRHWSLPAFGRTVIALSADAQANLATVPAALRPTLGAFELCGKATLPHQAQEIEIWASVLSAD
jgi:hypothetical protein